MTDIEAAKVIDKMQETAVDIGKIQAQLANLEAVVRIMQVTLNYGNGQPALTVQTALLDTRLQELTARYEEFCKKTDQMAARFSEMHLTVLNLPVEERKSKRLMWGAIIGAVATAASALLARFWKL